MFAYLLCLSFMLSKSMELPKTACEDFTTEPLCASPCVWFVDEGEGECLEASEVPHGAASESSSTIDLKVCSKITEQPECYGYAIDESEYEAGEPMTITKVGEETAVCTWNPKTSTCSSAVLAEMEAKGGMTMKPGEPEGMKPEYGPIGAGEFEPEIAEGAGGANPPVTEENMSQAAAIVEQVIDQATEMYAEMAAKVPAEGSAGEAPEPKEVKPMKAETFCPTLLTPEACVAPCVWAQTCMELDVALRRRNPLVERSSKNEPPYTVELSTVAFWQLATFAFVGLIGGITGGFVCTHCHSKEINNDVFVPLGNRHV